MRELTDFHSNMLNKRLFLFAAIGRLSQSPRDRLAVQSPAAVNVACQSNSERNPKGFIVKDKIVYPMGKYS